MLLNKKHKENIDNINEETDLKLKHKDDEYN